MKTRDYVALVVALVVWLALAVALAFLIRDAIVKSLS